MSEVSDWKTIDIENVRIDNLTLSAPQGSYWQKVMGAVKRMFNKMGDPADLVTTDKSSIVAAVNEVVASESFVKVYDETISGGTSPTEFSISENDLGGVFVDVVVSVSFPASWNNNSLEYTFSNGPSTIARSGGNVAPNAGHFTFSLLSDGGIGFHAQTYEDIYADAPSIQTSGLIFGDPAYPTVAKPGINSVVLAVGDSDAGFPDGTTITVYARRKVAVAAGGE